MAKANPDALVSERKPNKSYHFEGVGYVANDAMEQKTGQNIWLYLINKRLSHTHTPDVNFEWTDSLKKQRRLCPQLYKKKSRELGLGL